MAEITLRIAPQTDSALPKQERIDRVRSLAKEIQQLERVQRADPYETVYKSFGPHDLLDPAVIEVVIKNAPSIIGGIIGLLASLRKWRNQGDHKATSIEIKNINIGQVYYLLDRSNEDELEKEIKELIGKVEAGNRERASYVGIYDRRGKLLAVGVVRHEAFRRAKRLGFDLSSVEVRNVSAEQYHDWWWKQLSPEQREILGPSVGSMPP